MSAQHALNATHDASQPVVARCGVDTGDAIIDISTIADLFEHQAMAATHAFVQPCQSHLMALPNATLSALRQPMRQLLCSRDSQTLYWTVAQMLAYHTSNGSALDSGTILRGHCERPGFVRIGFGECRATTQAAQP